MLYIPAGRHYDRWAAECAQLCARMRWQVAAITGDAETARRLVLQGRALRVVVARPAHARAVQLAVVVATDPPPGPPPDPERPRRLR